MVNVQELTVAALMNENREHVYHAAMVLNMAHHRRDGPATPSGDPGRDTDRRLWRMGSRPPAARGRCRAKTRGQLWQRFDRSEAPPSPSSDSKAAASGGPLDARHPCPQPRRLPFCQRRMTPSANAMEQATGTGPVPARDIRSPTVATVGLSKAATGAWPHHCRWSTTRPMTSRHDTLTTLRRCGTGRWR